MSVGWVGLGMDWGQGYHNKMDMVGETSAIET